MCRIFAVFRGGKMPSLGPEFFRPLWVFKKPAGARKKTSGLRNVFFPHRTAKNHLLRLEDISCMKECKIPV
jgi:hypothetical protein